MPNVFKSGNTSTNGSIYKGQFTIGVDTTLGYGPTSGTSFWNGIIPSVGGYTIYQNKSANGPSIMTAANDSALVSALQLLGSTGSTAANVLDWASQQSNIMVANIDYPSIRMTTISNQTLLLDAGYVSSYPRQGTIWRDLGGRNYNGTLTNGPTFSSADGGSIVFDGTNDYVALSSTTVFKLDTADWSLSSWWKANGAQADFASIMSLNFVASNISQGSWAFKVKNAAAQNVFSFSYASALNTIVDVTSSAACNDGNWHYLVITRSGTSCIMYMDAVSVGTFTLPSNFLFQGSTNAVLGYTPRDNAYIKGNVALCSVNNFALTAAQVTSNFNALKGRFGL